MKRSITVLALFLVFSFVASAQETEQVKDSVTVVEEIYDQDALALKEEKKKQKAIAKNEKELKKAQKDQKKAEKEAKKAAKLAKAINLRRRAIDKSEIKITKLQSKVAKGKSRGKLSPVKEMEMNNKINKLRVNIAKDKEKLAKLERKQ